MTPLTSPIAPPSPFAGDVAELSLMVPSWQAKALLDQATKQGMTLGQYLRRVLHAVLQPGMGDLVANRN